VEVNQIVLFQFHFSSPHMLNNAETNSKVGTACQAKAGLAVDLIVGLGPRVCLPGQGLKSRRAYGAYYWSDSSLVAYST